MSDIIKLLPDSVANQIAAGEVVQRPASVVKELIENAVDSGATNITLIVKDAGRTLIQLIDNGCGMSPTDARMSFERHATSKISDANDLFQIRSKGFRGEALASIAAVAHVELKTKRREDELGTHLIIEGSKVIRQEPVNIANGSSFSVKNIFFNIPARRNFLKSNHVEWKHILDEFERIVLAHPEIDFELIHNDETIYKLPSSKLKQRLLNVFGNNYNDRLAPINETTTIVTVKGYIGKPDFAKKTRGEQYFFVNNRFIKSNYLHHAVTTAYQQLIDKTYHPSYFIFLDIDPQHIDVNIHPTKTEIKFDDEKAIYSILLSAVRQAIGIHNISPSIDFNQETSMNVLPPKLNQAVKIPSVNVNKSFNPFKREKSFSPFNIEAESELVFEQDNHQEELKFEADFNEGEVKKTNLFQIHNRYIVSQIKSGVIIVDQRQAHKRIVFEKIIKRIQKQSIASQQLIFPVTLEFSGSKFSLLKTIWDEVRSLGFDMEQFGNNTVVINGVPFEVSAENCDTIIKELLDKAAEGELNSKENFTENAAKLIADKTSIDKNKTLTNEEMQHLISELFSCENPYYTPNGKPTLKTFTTDDLNKIFD